MIPRLELSPYPHLATDRVIALSACREALARLETTRAWRPNENPLYDGEAWSGTFAQIFPTLNEADAVTNAAYAVLARFGVPLSEERSFAVMRQEVGQATRVHNDRPRAGEPTHRIMLYLAEPGEHYSGGQFCVFDTPSAEQPVRKYEPRAGCMIAFEASARSYHAVAPITSGRRVVLVLQFHHAGNCPVKIGALSRELEAAIDAFGRGRMSQPSKSASVDDKAKALLVRFGLKQGEVDTALRAVDDADPGLEQSSAQALASKVVGLSDAGYLAWWARRLARKSQISFSAADWMFESRLVATRPTISPRGQALLEQLYAKSSAVGSSAL